MSKSQRAQEALQLVTSLQHLFVEGLERIDGAGSFVKTSWLRDEGRHGGGSRYSTGDNAIFNRASVNVSQVHYDDDPSKKLGSATALSTIIHPRNPHAPSIHMHISWTEMKGGGEKEGGGYWRMMADLNPSNPDPEHADAFRACLRAVAPGVYSEASAQGDRYFYIPALDRHRGVAHYYLENFYTDDAQADLELAKRLGVEVIGCYLDLINQTLESDDHVSDEAELAQLAYHTLYFFQVLTLDRGTTSGLLVHDQNDVGIMGSLPSHVDKSLLVSWREKLPELQRELLDGLLVCLPEAEVNEVTVDVKKSLARAVRGFYQEHREALQFQASGNVIPPTVANHTSGA